MQENRSVLILRVADLHWDQTHTDIRGPAHLCAPGAAGREAPARTVLQNCWK